MHVEPFAERPAPRVLLVGLPTLEAQLLKYHLGGVASVEAVSFPGQDFDRAVELFQAQLVIVDLTYLEGELVRPLITHRFLTYQATIVYLAGDGGAIVDDLRAQRSRVLAEAGIATLVQLVADLPAGAAQRP